jgi:tRNA threonylcarbamoyladenosine biosynthesis protein TsaE
VILRTQTPSATYNLGLKLGNTLKAGDTVCLYGDLGAGKTVLAKGIAKAFGLESRDVASASYTIVAEYETTPPLYHIDLYRLEGGADLEALGLYEYLEGEGVAVIEWADKLPPDAVEKTISVTIKFESEDTREIIIEGTDEKNWNNM